MVYVVKFDGRREEFQKEKIIRTCLRVGVSQEVASSIADRVAQTVRDGMTTKELYQNILKELRTSEKRSAVAYSARELIAQLDPTLFEVFVKKMLEAHGYQCEHDRIIEGLCVGHQVDIIAKNDGTHLVECKRHHNPHRFCGLITSLQVQARLEDIRDGFAAGKNKDNFADAWIITNTKFSDHAIQYANAKKIRLTGWNFPHESSFAKMMDEKKIYPVSVLKAKKSDVQTMLNHGIITIHDLEEQQLISAGLDPKTAKNFMDQKKKILG